MDEYKTIAAPAEGTFTEQRSKFLAFAMPVQTAEQARECVADCRKKYYDARHVCWAYVLGADRTEFRANDDGEPSSTAGKPILGVINSNELTDILILVVRYFGGVKLGTGGLIAAYRAAAQAAIANAQVITKTAEETITITFDYEQLNSVMRIVKDEQLQILSQNFDTVCEMTLRVPRSGVEDLKKQVGKFN
ncbi:YigZ family protein [Candidatus Symbiothrix dinenymphae]|uniref:YigZ family protein n=1 Tax=Candidatus Symbiothrix dinenymphae TaxID=467085 RepID=UPI0006C550A7|nr:YigZ family protein [Candidatus Symbiothrix dinenymphae]GAP73337.1 hypothetical protein SAMD00024442_8_31 [Candidatus Symbiothrix dinenymphae]